MQGVLREQIEEAGREERTDGLSPSEEGYIVLAEVYTLYTYTCYRLACSVAVTFPPHSFSVQEPNHFLPESTEGDAKDARMTE